MSWSGISFIILRREISFSCGWRLVPVLRHQISLPDPKWLHFLPLLSFACGKVIPAHPGLCGCIYVFLFIEPTFLFSERISKTSNQHILSGQLVREMSKKLLSPRAGRGEWLATQKMIKLCYILHIFALCTLFLFLLFCPMMERKIDLPPFMDKLFAKEVKTAFGIPHPPFGEESTNKNLTDFLWFAEKDKRISKHFVQFSFRRHWFLTLVAILPISVTTLSTSEFDFSANC